MKYALFTGAGGGLGSACVRQLTAAGWTVFAADISSAVPAADLATPSTIPLILDVTNQASIDDAVATVKQTTDKLDAVINFAGLHTMGSLVEGDVVATMQKMIDVNLMGMLRVNRAFFEMLLGGGRIINCSSECGYMKAQPFNGLYTITKYAVEAYTDSLRRELLGLGIPVIKIQPGSFNTHLLVDAQSGFDNLISTTQYHKRMLKRMQPLMARELSSANDPEYVAKAVLEAAQKRRPKINYRVKNSKLMGVMELIPDSWLDVVYKALS